MSDPIQPEPGEAVAPAPDMRPIFVDNRAGNALARAIREHLSRLRGAVLCGHDGRRGVLYRLAVATSHRRRGLGRALVERSLAALRAEGIPRCMLYVLAVDGGGLEFWWALWAVTRGELHLLSIDLDA